MIRREALAARFRAVTEKTGHAQARTLEKMTERLRRRVARLARLEATADPRLAAVLSSARQQFEGQIQMLAAARKDLEALAKTTEQNVLATIDALATSATPPATASSATPSPARLARRTRRARKDRSAAATPGS